MEKKAGVNPILPLSEYIPDGEPHVFGNRIYLFGSHDTENGTRYCAEENYVCWSAALDNPEEWTYEGVIYESKQDPLYGTCEHLDMYAPDVVCGNDGKYYLYYNPNSSADGASGHNRIHVAVCDTPAGHYEYLGYVRNPDGSLCHPYLMGDPAVINDEGTIRLYFGWSLSMVAAAAHRGQEAQRAGAAQNRTPQGAPRIPEPGDPEMNRKLAPIYQMLFKRSLEQVADLEYPLMGANTVVLQDDMLTAASPVKRIVPGQFDTPKDSSFFGHAFYEASSIRKIGNTYYFIYSSENSHELCYAVSDRPDEGFTYGGTIISNGDVGYLGRTDRERLNQTANDHGSLECVNGQWYIFHHRQTHRSTFSRQACAEKVTIHPDGHIEQVECTSMGLHGGALPAEGCYPAGISCILTNGEMPHITNTQLDRDIPYFTNEEEERFITGIQDGTLIGYKYFAFRGETELTLTVRGSAGGKMIVSVGEKDKIPVEAARIQMSPCREWTKIGAELNVCGEKALYFTYKGEGRMDFLEFELR